MTAFDRPCSKAETFDWTALVEMDPRDPRLMGRGPCGAKRVPEAKYRTNQYCAWLLCSRCSLRLAYVPGLQAPGAYVSMGPTPEVSERCLEEIRDIPPKEIDGNMMRGLIRMHEGVIQASRRSSATRPEAGSPSTARPEARVTSTANPTTAPRAKDPPKNRVFKARPKPTNRASSSRAPITSPPTSLSEVDQDSDNVAMDRCKIVILKYVKRMSELEAMIMEPESFADI